MNYHVIRIPLYCEGPNPNGKPCLNVPIYNIVLTDTDNTVRVAYVCGHHWNGDAPDKLHAIARDIDRIRSLIITP
jgi:hypothetical protein